jgi:hypothetical protein
MTLAKTILPVQPELRGDRRPRHALNGNIRLVLRDNLVVSGRSAEDWPSWSAKSLDSTN